MEVAKKEGQVIAVASHKLQFDKLMKKLCCKPLNNLSKMALVEERYPKTWAMIHPETSLIINLPLTHLFRYATLLQ